MPASQWRMVQYGHVGVLRIKKGDAAAVRLKANSSEPFSRDRPRVTIFRYIETSQDLRDPRLQGKWARALPFATTWQNVMSVDLGFYNRPFRTLSLYLVFLSRGAGLRENRTENYARNRLMPTSRTRNCPVPMESESCPMRPVFICSPRLARSLWREVRGL